tara:strand:- start:220 stop:483 length:264 start_codon:yes stop_codon:yes gene_type:complete
MEERTIPVIKVPGRGLRSYTFTNDTTVAMMVQDLNLHGTNICIDGKEVPANQWATTYLGQHINEDGSVSGMNVQEEIFATGSVKGNH